MPQSSDDGMTIAAGPAVRPPTSPAPPLAPGAVLAGRYRLVALLGRGGMGEVYRADDLVLEHPVALKFLPHDGTQRADGGGDGARLAQLYSELRLARQVSHKNVCRLYDLGEADGRPFLTMEYVDGEDLASLLRRIGRLPPDKAVDIARQLCAGLAAAHERGVLHRDLKPANVMLDGEGNVRITDFGIAALEGDTSAVRAGTPQFMAPEQLRGEPASVKTDIYALGLILFEIFTGRRAYDGKTLDDLRRVHESGVTTTPSSIVRDLDPAVERAILRCLERDPARRPASALAVAAALPGGNPLAAALAAGETPSPGMLAAAGESEALAIARGLAAVAGSIVGIVVVAALSARVSVAGRVPLDKPPAVLVDRVQSVVRTFGYTDTPVDEVYDFNILDDYLRWIGQTDRGPHRWDVLASGSPPALGLWYRSAPRVLVPNRHGAIEVTPNDPPVNDTGMRIAVVDTRGRLIEFRAVPPQLDPSTGPAPAPRWSDLFAAAGLSMAAFTPTAPQWMPRDFADTVAAWEGPLADRPDLRVRVEAAAYRGRLVSFYLIGPWSRPARMQRVQPSTLDTVVNEFLLVMLLVLFAGAAWLARYNVRVGRGDRRAATRLALVIMAVAFVEWAVTAHHTADISLEFRVFIRVFQVAAGAGLIMWVLYVAIEPFARRFWPDSLLGWSRLLGGYIRDPRVGRDLLIGALFGVAILLTRVVRLMLPAALGYPAVMPITGTDVGVLTRATAVITAWGDALLNSPAAAFFAVMVFVMLQLVLHRRWLAIVLGTAVIAVVGTNSAATVLWLDVAFQILIAVLVTFLIVRFGLLAASVAFVVWAVGADVPLTLHVAHWSAAGSNLTIAGFIALVAFGFVASRAGQPLFGHFEV